MTTWQARVPILSAVLSTFCIAIIVKDAEGRRKTVQQEIHMRTIELPNGLLREQGGLKTLLHEMRAVEETMYVKAGTTTKLPESYRKRYGLFRRLILKATAREETLTFYSEAREMWLTCASLRMADEPEPRLYCGRYVALRDDGLKLPAVRWNQGVAVAGKKNTTGEVGLYGWSAKQFDFDEEEQSCQEEEEEKLFDFPTSRRMVDGTKRVLVEAASGIMLTT